MITAIVTSYAMLVFILTVLFIREWTRRRALEEVLRQSLAYWRISYDERMEGLNHDSD